VPFIASNIVDDQCKPNDEEAVMPETETPIAPDALRENVRAK
jgi:hypothetical protein